MRRPVTTTKKPKPQGPILRALFGGAVILVQYTNGPKSNKNRTYTLSSTGAKITEAAVMRLLADNLIKPNKDGLFDDGPPQSYSLFRTSEGGA